VFYRFKAPFEFLCRHLISPFFHLVAELRALVAEQAARLEEQAARTAELELVLAKAKRDSSTSSKLLSSNLVKLNRQRIVSRLL
jgi:hypothetical protein